MNEPVSIRLHSAEKARADALIRYLKAEYPLVSQITRHAVLREAVLRGLAEMEHKARAKDLL